jgi:hypothetical protein
MEDKNVLQDFKSLIPENELPPEGAEEPLSDMRSSDVSLARDLIDELRRRFGPCLTKGKRNSFWFQGRQIPPDYVRRIVHGFECPATNGVPGMGLRTRRISDIIREAAVMLPWGQP